MKQLFASIPRIRNLPGVRRCDPGRARRCPLPVWTVEYQEKLDLEQASGNHRAPVTSLFGLEEKEVSKPSDDEED